MPSYAGLDNECNFHSVKKRFHGMYVRIERVYLGEQKPTVCNISCKEVFAVYRAGNTHIY